MPTPAMTTGGSTEPVRSSTLTATATHLAAVAFFFLLLRVFAVSGYGWNTAFAVSTTLGLDDGLALLFGSLMAGHLLTAALLIGVVPLLIAAYLWGAPGRRPVLALLLGLSVVLAAALTGSFHAWWLPPAVAAVLGALALVRCLPPDSRLRRASALVLTKVGWVTAIAALLVAGIVQTPWVPHERIETTHGTVHGWVLSVDSGYLNVLTDEHEFVILVSGDVRSRH